MTAQETRKAPMSILVVGLGVIGTTYGYLFQKAGHRVEHLVRKSSTRAAVSSLEVEILGGHQPGFCHDHRALHAVFEFANIARPPPAVDRRKGI